MSFFSISGLAIAIFILAITPGPGVFATISRSLASGFSNASVVVAGIVLGDIIFLLLAIFGLSAVAEILGSLFKIVKYCGGAYLIWLGIKIWLSRPESYEIEGVRELSFKANFFSGLFITLGNPKVILFYLGFLPTFIDLSSLSFISILIVVCVISAVLGSVLLFYAYTAGKAGLLFKSQKAKQNMNRAAAGVMISTGTVIIGKS